MVQVSNTPINLRVRFNKIGSLQYISHLDLVRTMHKVIVRAKLPLWYTEGFNPKPKMVFAAPLSIGTESYAEFVDIRLSERMSPEEALASLNRNMTSELQAIEAYYPERKLTELKWLSYTVTLKTEGSSQKLATECESALLSDKVEIEKKTKSGELATVDIRPLIKSINATFDQGEIKISAVLSADSSAFLNPEHLIKYLKKRLNVLSSSNLLSESYSIIRNEAYLEDMSVFR